MESSDRSRPGFQGFIGSVLASQDTETYLSKQPVLASYGNAIKSLFSQLPPELSGLLMGAYNQPTPDIIKQIEDAILLREYAIERAENEANLEKGWLEAANAEGTQIGYDDEWNS